MEIQNIRSNEQVFAARTKQKNCYDKVYGGKLIGATITGAYLAPAVIKTKKMLLSVTEQLKNNGTGMDKYEKEALEELSKMSIKRLGKMAGLAAIPFALGIGIDALINHHRTKKADKAAN